MKPRWDAVVGGLGVALVLTLALAGRLVAPFDPDAVDASAVLQAPSAAHWLGTDAHGRDLLSRVLVGTRVTVGVALSSVAVGAALGTGVGALAGWVGGWLDRGLSAAGDLMLALPRLVLLLALLGLFRPRGAEALPLVVGVLALTGWMVPARLVRAEVRGLRERPFVEAAATLGMPPLQILRLHVLPHALPPVAVQALLAVGATMLAEAALSFLGIGVQPPTATWGTLLADGRTAMRSAPWIALAPGAMLTGTLLSFHLLGEAVARRLIPGSVPLPPR